jgi:hypothetical protein
VVANPGAKVKSIKFWTSSNKKYLDSCRRGSEPYTITIRDLNDIKGTYFHPAVFIHALEWACPGFRDFFGADFEIQLVHQNLLLFEERIPDQSPSRTRYQIEQEIAQV